MTTKIEWAEETWNPTTGCTKISPGCAHCYIERTPPMRMAGRKFVKGSIPMRLHPERIAAPLRWRKPRRVFVNSMSDLFHDDVPDSFITAVFGVMSACPRHTFMVLTKRAQRMRAWGERMRAAGGLEVYIRSEEGRNSLREHFDEVIQRDMARGITMRSLEDPWMRVFSAAGVHQGTQPPSNVWLGVSVENQEQTQRIEHLLATPAAVRFLSVEPMLGEIDLSKYLNGGRNIHMGIDVNGAIKNKRFDFFTDSETGRKLSRGEAELELKNYRNQGIRVIPMGDCPDWDTQTGCPGHRIPSLDGVICGGESGPGARPMHPAWARSLRDQCAAADVPFFFKQWGEWRPYDNRVDEYVAAGPYRPPSNTIRLRIDGADITHTGVAWREGDEWMTRVGKKAAGRLLDGVEHNAFPQGVSPPTAGMNTDEHRSEMRNP